MTSVVFIRTLTYSICEGVNVGQTSKTFIVRITRHAHVIKHKQINNKHFLNTY